MSGEIITNSESIEPMEGENHHMSTTSIATLQFDQPQVSSHLDNDDKGGQSDSDRDGAEEVLEESPDKRWSKRREKVKQRDVPGIDAAYLAMDNETGNEVVWNEVLFSERKNFREQEEKLKAVFDNLTHLVHVNLVKFHKYWTDSKSEKPRVIFITEYMSSGSMSRFLQRARSSGSVLNIKAWKKWTTQILSALNYLHSCDPPIVHANLSCNTVFIQQNGLIKIGCVAPNAIHHHVKTFRENIKNMHYLAPEYEHLNESTTQADIYAFGICALEMIGALHGCNVSEGSSTSTISQCSLESIRKSIESLEPLQRDFIEKCLNPNPDKRPTARELLFHPAIFEVHSLKLIAAHAIVNSKLFEQLAEDELRAQADSNAIVASSKFRQLSYADLQTYQVDLDKYLEDVRNGIYPLIAFARQPSNMPSIILKSSTSLSAIASSNANGNLSHPDSIRYSISGQTSGGLGQHYDQNSEHFSSVEHNNDGHSGASTSFDERGLNDDQISTGAFSNFENSNRGLENLGQQTQQQQQFLSQDGYTQQLQNLSGYSGNDEGYHTAQSIVGVNHPQQVVTPSIIPTGSYNGESRLILQMSANIEGSTLQVLLRLDDQMNRQLTTEISDEDTAENLVVELVQHGFISEVDSNRMNTLLRDVLDQSRNKRSNSPA